jgi:hypothetical protein
MGNAAAPGWDAELVGPVDFLRDHLDRKVLLVCAPAGAGKTALLRAFAAAAEADGHRKPTREPNLISRDHNTAAYFSR